MKNGKRITAVLLTCLVLVSSLCGFTDYRGLGTAYYESEIEIFDGAVYKEIISGHPFNGLQHSHYVEADTENGEIIPLVFNGEVRGTYSVGKMVKYAEEQGYKVIAAVNGDIFDTASGTPKNLVIHDYNIVTSGYDPDRVFAFDEDGRAEMLPAKLEFKLKGTIENRYEVQVPVEVPVETPDVSQEDRVDVPENPEDVLTEGGEAVEPESAETEAEPVTEIVYETVYETQYKTEESEWESKIDFFNVPHGGANGLHLFNRHYSTSTKTSGDCIEVVIECEDIQLKVNDSINGIIKSVNSATSNTEITDKTIVLSTVSGSATAEMLSKLKVGSEIEISVEDTDDCGLEDVKECVGIYYSLVENGRNVTTTGAANPRTALGIKRDGTVVLFELDGRQQAVSKGLSLSEVADAMIDMGCVTAVNLDGGGSSVMYVREPGKDTTATRQSSPSNGSERYVANALLLVYKDSAENEVRRLNVYPELSFVMPGGEVKLETFASNSLYEKVSSFDPETVTYSVNSSYGSIDENSVFKASDRTGEVVITASSGSKKGTTIVNVVDDINIIPSVSQLTVDAGETRDIDVKASFGDNGAVINVNTFDNLFSWSCDESIGTIDENGVFTATTSALGSNSGNIYVEYNEEVVTIPVTVGAYIVEFTDTYGHWANEYIGTLAGMNILNGIGDNMFNPEGSLTRAQFIAMLAKMTDGIDVSASAPAGFTDVPDYEWYYGYVNWGYENGIVNGMGDGTFAPNASITREQMAVMLCNYARSIGFMLPQVKENVTFTDYNSISPWSLDYVLTTAGAGIINGFDTGDFQPQGVATRAQAATVIYKMCEIKGML